VRRQALCTGIAAAFLAGAWSHAQAGHLRGGYAFAGGTKHERATVRAAMGASAFDWASLRGKVTIHIGRGTGCHAAPGQVWLDSAMLAHGRAAWGVVLHELGHEVDYLRFDAATRARLNRVLGGKTWWPNGRFRHDRYGAERFASTFSYAYWPSSQNVLIRKARREATAMPPRRFRRLLKAVLDA
jgi:hypothetical protein